MQEGIYIAVKTSIINVYALFTFTFQSLNCVTFTSPPLLPNSTSLGTQHTLITPLPSTSPPLSPLILHMTLADLFAWNAAVRGQCVVTFTSPPLLPNSTSHGTQHKLITPLPSTAPPLSPLILHMTLADLFARNAAVRGQCVVTFTSPPLLPNSTSLGTQHKLITPLPSTAPPLSPLILHMTLADLFARNAAVRGQCVVTFTSPPLLPNSTSLGTQHKLITPLPSTAPPLSPLILHMTLADLFAWNAAVRGQCVVTFTIRLLHRVQLRFQSAVSDSGC